MTAGSATAQPSAEPHIGEDVLDPHARELLRALQAADADAVRTALHNAGPAHVVEYVTEQIAGVVRRIGPDLVEVVPELALVRAVALLQDFSRPGEQAPTELLAAIVALFKEGNIEWAVASACHWLLWQRQLSDVASGFATAERLFDDFPQLCSSPTALSRAALLAALAGRYDAARALWQQIAEHPLLVYDSDEAWLARLDWASSWMIGPEPDLREAVRVLRRVRDHFRGRTSYTAFNSFVVASMNLTHVLLLLGRSAEAVLEVDQDVLSCPPAGEHAAYLHC